MTSSTIESLATTIAKSAQELRTLLAQHDLEEPSFAADCPPSMDLPPAVDEARNTLLHAACEIQDLLLDPADLLRSYATHAHLVSLHFIQQFNIAQLVPTGGKTTTFAVLAKQCGLPEADVRRLLRHAMSIRVFDEPRDNEVVHTRASMLLRQEGIHGWIGSTCENSWVAATRGFALANNNLTLYEALAQSPERGATFAANKRGYTSGPAFHPAAFLEAYRPIFAPLPPGSLFVDVGGAHGDIALAAAASYPHLQYIVQDLPEVIATAPRDSSPDGRVEFSAHDFFTPQPLRNVAVFYLRHILHNFGDARAISILRALVPGMRPGTRVLLNEHVLDPQKQPMWKRRQDSAMDMNMLVLFNARERNEAEWRALLQSADARFAWVGVRRPAGSALAVVESCWEGDSNDVR
ncbi:Sterigmatocystin 8-O-methyltransferase [Penicillium riverlandense]|uniref:Sterigmatocystin 8-O-methyltransferase n=1 Tax=Penicillium riverlandense TaxID=1903569 RepID=UPI0025477F3A|nr:Sterigmatocystin 8-O-methyltransferase [Penicillium riverlandense]KAJ5825967.1 Sterigmatocystin 8-O-methyltransferase [Penicillium riverlandense]